MRIVSNQIQLFSPTQSENSASQVNHRIESGSDLSLSELDSTARDKAKVKQTQQAKLFPVIARLAGDSIIVENIEDQSVEEIERANAIGDIGTKETTPEGLEVFKFAPEKVKELESLGIKSVQFHGPSGVRTFTSFKIQALSDKELDLLISKVRIQIIFLKAQAQAKPEDKEIQQKIVKQKTKLGKLVSERAARKNEPKDQEVVRTHVESNYSVEMKLIEIWAKQRAMLERQQLRIEEKYWENKKVEEVTKKSQEDRTQKATKEIFLRQEAQWKAMINKEGESPEPALSLLNIGRLLDLYLKLFGKD